MQDYTPKTPLVLGVSPLTNKVYAYRGQKREDITDEFHRFIQPLRTQLDTQAKRMAALEKVVEAARDCRDGVFDARRSCKESVANLDALGGAE